MLGLAAALLATTASAELWIPSIFSGSGKTAPVHQPHGSAHPTRAAAAGERDDTRGSAHKLRGNFGTGIVVPADDAEVPKTPDPVDVPKIDVPVDDAKKTTEADYDIENVELPPVESTPTTNETIVERPSDAGTQQADAGATPPDETSTNTTPGPVSMLYTWGIGGDRVGRPSDSAATPPGRAEGTFDPSNESAIHAAASGHSLMVTNAGFLYTAGRNDSAGGGGHGSPPVKDAGQLGRGGAMDAFGRVPIPKDEPIVQCAAGRYHSCALTKSGKIVTFGLNDRGQLGRHGTYGVTDGDGCVCDSGGSCACDAVDGGGEGRVEYTAGDECVGGAACRSGSANFVDVSSFGSTATAVAAGRYASAAVLADGQVVTWGLNLCGSGGGGNMTRESLLRDPTSAAKPRLVTGIDAKAVAVTFGYVQMAVLTDDGELYTCDTGFDGYASGLGNAYKPNGEKALGRVASDAESALAPGRVDFGSDVKIAAISTGRCHAAVATTTGAMMAFGCGKLGGGDVKGLPTKVPDAPSGVYDVACGEYFTLASTEDGDLFGWGDGKSGQMGVDGKEAGDKPYKVEVKLGVRRGERVRVVSPVAGYQHALAIAVPGDDS